MIDLADPSTDTVLRLIAAACIGMAIGLNRDITGKQMGMRTLGLVALGSALVPLAVVHYAQLDQHADALSRVIQGALQGVLTGVGFLGAGVILHSASGKKVHGLTTAATVWVVAALGIACALAAWYLVFTAAGMTLFILIVMKPAERALVKWFDRFKDHHEDPPMPH